MRDNLEKLSLTKSCKFYYNGIDALEAARQCIQEAYDKVSSFDSDHIQPLDFMLLDMQMPGLTGIQVIQKVRDKITQLNLDQSET